MKRLTKVEKFEKVEKVEKVEYRVEVGLGEVGESAWIPLLPPLPPELIQS
jgi:hypothetical protein